MTHQMMNNFNRYVKMNQWTSRVNNFGIFIFASFLYSGQLLMERLCSSLTLLHSERPKLYTILAFLSAIGLREDLILSGSSSYMEPSTKFPKLSPFDKWWKNMAVYPFT